MKDLKRFITKKNIKKYKREVKLPIAYASPTDIEFLAYCVFNSFKELENQAMNFSRYIEGEEYISLTFQTYGCNVLEDYDLPSCFIRDLLLDSLLPDYDFDEVEVYFDSYFADMEEDYFQENIDLIMDFVKKHKIKMKKYKSFLNDESSLDSSTIYSYIIRSNYLKLIYNDIELRTLFEKAIPDGEFESPTKFMALIQIYHDGYGDGPQIDKTAFINFVEAYKNKIKRKREYKHNYLQANQLVEINAFSMNSSDQSFISYLLDGVFETRTEVMF